MCDATTGASRSVSCAFEIVSIRTVSVRLECTLVIALGAIESSVLLSRRFSRVSRACTYIFDGVSTVWDINCSFILVEPTDWVAFRLGSMLIASTRTCPFSTSLCCGECWTFGWVCPIIDVSIRSRRWSSVDTS